MYNSPHRNMKKQDNVIPPKANHSPVIDYNESKLDDILGRKFKILTIRKFSEIKEDMNYHLTRVNENVIKQDMKIKCIKKINVLKLLKFGNENINK